MRRARTACIFLSPEIVPCYEPTLIKEAWSFARNCITEEADLSNQAEMAALAETTADSRLGWCLAMMRNDD